MASGTAEAFIPKPAHLVYMVCEKLRQPAGLEVYQTRKNLDFNAVENPVVNIEEKLLFLFPDRLRTEIVSGPYKGLSLESGTEFLRVLDGRIVSHEKNPVDRYTDILLYRNYENMLSCLAGAGIDIASVSLHRYHGKICYVLGISSGNDEGPGLWIEKDSFLPVRYVIYKNRRKFEIFYDHWQDTGRIQYPAKISIFSDDRLFSVINAVKINLKSGFSSSLFDPDNIRHNYLPELENPGSRSSDSGDELDKTMQNFKQSYE